MSYTNETTYYGLPLPTGSDKSTFTDNNTAFQAVDAALHTAYEQSGAATEDIVAIKATVANLIQADIDFQSDLDTEKGKIRNLQDKEVLQDAAIAAVKADAFDMITAYNEPTATSTHAYSVGDYFIYNDVLYRATEAISVGTTIVPDTNCTTINVTTELKDLYGLDYVEVVSDGTKSTKELLDSLATQIDISKVTAKSYLVAGFNRICAMSLKSGSTLNFIGGGYSSSDDGILNYTVKVAPNASAYGSFKIATDGTVSRSDDTSTVHSANSFKIELHY